MRLSGIEGRVALVTGAANGIGRAVAGRFAGEGARVAAVDVNRAGLETLEEELGAAALRPYVVDLTRADEVGELAERVPREVGDVDFLINVAGGAVRPSHDEPLPERLIRFPDMEEIVELEL